MDNAGSAAPLGYAGPPVGPQPAPLAPAIPLVPGLVDAAGRVAGDVPCRKCSYNLRGQEAGGRCPECGAPVGVALHGPVLRYGDPEWVRKLARGAAFVFWGIIVALVVGFVSVFVSMAAGPLIGPLFYFAGGLVYLYGAWVLTEPDPSGSGEDRYGTVRKIIRVTLLVSLAQGFFSALTQRSIAAPGLAAALGMGSVAMEFVGVVGDFATLSYLGRLAERIPDPALASRAQLLFWGYGSTRAVSVVARGASTLLGLFIPRGAAAGLPAAGTVGVYMGLGCLSLATLVGMLVFGIMYLVFLYRLQVEFDRQAEYARMVWAGMEAGPPRASGEAV